MKKRSDRIRKIVALAALEERRESIAVGHSQQELDSAVERLDELNRYRSEYTARTPAGAGSALRWSDYQSFLARLDQAVTAQREVILDGERNVAAHRRRWMVKRRRLNSLERVLERYRGEERVAAERLAQKRLDEFKRRDDFFGDD